ncbi:t-SNARE [Lichtheimia hyalospora FSU 10163]|nr:t-SNARE [Lichtheimia hyalospora FSU 10163]
MTIKIEALWKRFFETVERYQDMERMYERKYRQRIERQIKLVKPNASQDQVDRIVDSNDPSQIFAQSLVHTTRSNQGQQVLAEVQNRHEDIKHIEKTIVELHQMLADMSMLVDQQGEMMTNIEQNAEYAVGHVQQGNTIVDRAIKQAKATRHKKWICLVLFILICVAIGVLVWWFGFDHPVSWELYKS